MRKKKKANRDVSSGKIRNVFAFDYWEEKPERSISPISIPPVASRLLAGIEESKRFKIIYDGGSNPEVERWIRPIRVYKKGVADYVDAFCETRGEERCFNVARIKILTARSYHRKDLQ